MRCPFCGDGDSQVVDSRLSDPGDAVRRRRRCRSCDRRFTTYERYDQGPLYIRKRSGGREPFDRAKVLAGLERAAIKRPIEREQLEARGRPDRRRAARPGRRRRAPSEVGELALRGLRELDAVAYVRFASVYRKFEDVAEFEAELERLDARAAAAARAPLRARRERAPERQGSVRTRRQAACYPLSRAKSARRERLGGRQLREIRRVGGEARWPRPGDEIGTTHSVHAADARPGDRAALHQSRRRTRSTRSSGRRATR